MRCTFIDDVNWWPRDRWLAPDGLHLITSEGSGETGPISVRCQFIFDMDEFVIDQYAQVDSFNTRLIKNAGLKIQVNNSSWINESSVDLVLSAFKTRSSFKMIFWDELKASCSRSIARFIPWALQCMLMTLITMSFMYSEQERTQNRSLSNSFVDLKLTLPKL